MCIQRHSLVSLFVVVLTMSACKDPPEQITTIPARESNSTQDAGPPLPVKPVDLFSKPGDSDHDFRPENIPLVGEADIANKYSFTVLLYARGPSARGVPARCSGVLISPRLALTAGHCVCPPRSAPHAPALINRSVCAESVFLEVVTYLPQKNGDGSTRYQVAWSEGVVHPHPALKILLDERGRVTASQANLAVISLKTPLPERFRSVPVNVAKTEVEVQAPVLMVGHGNDGTRWELRETRRFNRTRVAGSPAGQERISLAPPDKPLFANDGGGACVRETTQGLELIGISNRGLGGESTCTSTFFHRAWINDELLKAAKAQ